MEFLVGVVILVLDVIAILDALKAKLPTEKKILWVLLIIVLPVLGLILYYLAGRPQK